MAGLILKVDPRDLKAKSASVKKLISDVEKNFNEMDKTVNATKRYWEGDASDKHIRDYAKLKTKIQEVIKSMKERPVDLEQMAGIYEETERDAVSKASTLPTDIF